MRTSINKALDQVETLIALNAQELNAMDAEPLIKTLQLVQDAYVEIILRALRSLLHDNQQESHDLLQEQRDQLGTTFERISTLIEEISETKEPMYKLIIEYLFTRARLVDELKLFPNFGLELLDRLTLDESLDETIAYMERVMTGKQDLYLQIMELHASNAKTT